MAGSPDTPDFCFVHSADLHLDTPFKGVSAAAPHVGQALREASLEAFDSLVELCLDRDAAFLVLAGDIYDGAKRGLRAQLRFRDGLQRLSDAGIASFVAHGNHDPVSGGWSAIKEWPEMTHVFSHRFVETIPVERRGRLLALVQGTSYATPSVTDNLSLGFARDPSAAFQVGVLHCNVAGSADGYAAYSPCTRDDLLRVGLDYWALGHIHSRMVLSGQPFGDEPWIVYSGNLQARSPKPSEHGPKGASVVSVSGGRVASVEAVACDRIRFATVELSISALPGAVEVVGALGDLANAELGQADGRSLILRATLVDRGPAHAGLAREGAIGDLLQSLRDEFSSGSPFCWWDRIDDRSLPDLDLADLRRGSDFSADLLSLSESLMEDSSGIPDDLLAEVLAQLPSQLRRQMSEQLAEEHGGDLVGASLMVALDHIGGEA